MTKFTCQTPDHFLLDVIGTDDTFALIFPCHHETNMPTRLAKNILFGVNTLEISYPKN